jgi:hypothetical protein
MAQQKTEVLTRVDVAVGMAALTLVAVLAPLLRVQLLTGIIVNACLVIALATLGKKPALGVALFPSTVAALSGTLPPALVPLIPVIVIANAVLIHVFDFFKGRGFAAAALASSFAKYAFLSLAGYAYLAVFSTPAVSRGIAAVISYMQLITALLGCLAAYFIVRWYKSKKCHV